VQPSRGWTDKPSASRASRSARPGPREREEGEADVVAVEDMAADVVAADMVVDVAEDMAADVGAEDTAARVDMEEARVDMAAAEVAMEADRAGTAAEVTDNSSSRDTEAAVDMAATRYTSTTQGGAKTSPQRSRAG